MKTVGRNDPCPCGSGLKYKRCCGLSAGGDRYRAVRSLDALAESELSAFFFARYGKDDILEAWRDFQLDAHLEVDPEDSAYPLFGRWLLYDWTPDEYGSAARAYLDSAGAAENEPLRRFIRSVLDSPYSFYQLRSVDSGVSLHLRDILRQRELRVTDTSASRDPTPGCILYGRVVEEPGLAYFMGSAGGVLRPVQLQQIASFRSATAQSLDAEGDVLTTRHLLMLEDVLRWKYFGLENSLHEPPDLRNTDGEPFEFHSISYDVDSFAVAFDRLKFLELSVTRGDDSSLRGIGGGRERGKSGAATIHWLKRTGGSSTITATLRLKRKRLTVEVNSERRARMIKKEVVKRLGEEAVFLREEIYSADEMLRRANAKKSRRGAAPPADPRALPDNRPEIREALAAVRNRHWQEWTDRAVPALDGMTPRDAASSERGRELLEALFWEYEMNNFSSSPENRIDVSALAKTIGLNFSPPQGGERERPS